MDQSYAGRAGIFSRWTNHMQEWVARAGKIPEIAGRQLLVYKHNILDHIGTVSSFKIRPNRPKWPGCYESMANVWSLIRVRPLSP
eukprot:8165181-Pyramimonas_sp.AAC.1